MRCTSKEAILSCLLGLGFVLSGCVSNFSGTPFPYSSASSLLKSQQIISEYGEVSGTSCPGYFAGILERTLQSSRHQPLEVIVLATNHPMALSPGDGRILVSRGLIRLLSTEAETAFMLTHEAGHYFLGHHEKLKDSNQSDTFSNRHDLELEADSFSLGKIVEAGYDPTYAISALTAVYRGIEEQGLGSEYPSLQNRISTLATQVLQARALGSGLADRRGFRRCKLELNQ